VSGHYACVAETSRWDGANEVTDSLRVLDVADPANPREVGMSEPGSSLRGVAVSGDYVYVASCGSATDPGGLLVIDISDRAHPQTLTLYPTGGRALAGLVSGRYAYVAYVADNRAGFDVIDISDRATPRGVGTYELGGQGITDLVISGNYERPPRCDWVKPQRKWIVHSGPVSSVAFATGGGR
jgi:hypothetical protein